MTNPFSLFDALELEGIPINNKAKQNVVDDTFWEYQAESSKDRKNNKRQSYVYYADNCKLFGY